MQGSVENGISLHNSMTETCEAGPEFGESPCLVELPARRLLTNKLSVLAHWVQGMSETYLLIMRWWSSTADSGPSAGPISQVTPRRCGRSCPVVFPLTASEANR